jgi:hypothetical protein
MPCRGFSVLVLGCWLSRLATVASLLLRQSAGVRPHGDECIGSRAACCAGPMRAGTRHGSVNPNSRGGPVRSLNRRRPSLVHILRCKACALDGAAHLYNSAASARRCHSPATAALVRATPSAVSNFSFTLPIRTVSSCSQRSPQPAQPFRRQQQAHGRPGLDGSFYIGGSGRTDSTERRPTPHPSPRVPLNAPTYHWKPRVPMHPWTGRKGGTD